MAEGPAPVAIRTESTGAVVSGVCIAFLMLSILFTSLRFYTRAVIIKALGKDDWAILIATVMCVICTVAACFEVKYGLGRHIENVTEAETLERFKYLMLAITSYNFGMNAAKLGFLYQYQRIFQSDLVQAVCFWFIIYVYVWTVVQCAVNFLACVPFGFLVPNGTAFCVDSLIIWFVSSGMSTVTDLLIFCIPLRPVWKLQLPRKQRLTVLAIFCLGFFVCIVSIYRLSTLYVGAVSPDPTWDDIDAAIWSSVELGVSIIASSLPTLRPLVARVLPGAGLSTAAPRRGRSSYVRHGGASASLGGSKSPIKSAVASGHGGSGRADSILTEELALGDVDPAAAVVYTNASSDRSDSFAEPADRESKGQIRMTANITANTGKARARSG